MANLFASQSRSVFSRTSCKFQDAQQLRKAGQTQIPTGSNSESFYLREKKSLLDGFLAVCFVVDEEMDSFCLLSQ